MQIEISTGPNCAYCAAAKRLLDERARAYIEKDVSDETCLTEFRERLPRHRSLPQIFVDGAHIGGYEDLRLRIDGLAGSDGNRGRAAPAASQLSDSATFMSLT